MAPPFDQNQAALIVRIDALRDELRQHATDTRTRFETVSKELQDLRKTVERRNDEVGDEFDRYQQRVTRLEQGMTFRTWVGGMLTAVLTYLQFRGGSN